jgi:hypothetical protein
MPLRLVRAYSLGYPLGMVHPSILLVMLPLIPYFTLGIGLTVLLVEPEPRFDWRIPLVTAVVFGVWVPFFLLGQWMDRRGTASNWLTSNKVGDVLPATVRLFAVAAPLSYIAGAVVMALVYAFPSLIYLLRWVKENLWY